jgi:hypothetical protein
VFAGATSDGTLPDRHLFHRARSFRPRRANPTNEQKTCPAQGKQNEHSSGFRGRIWGPSMCARPAVSRRRG